MYKFKYAFLIVIPVILLLAFSVKFFGVEQEETAKKVSFIEPESDTPISVGVGMATFPVYNNIQELESASSIIVEASFTGVRDINRIYDEQTGNLVEQLSKTEMKISKSYKGDLKSNENILILEPAYIQDDVFYSIEGYNLVQPNNKYLLFLRPFKEGKYTIVGMFQGKFDKNKNTVSKSFSPKLYSEIKNVEFFGNDLSLFKKLKTEALEKYK